MLKMIESVIDLPPELGHQIYKYCSKSDLINLACCSRQHYDAVKYILYSVIRIPWKIVETESFLDQELDNLKFTARLCFSDYDLSSLFNKVVWEYISDNYQNILQHTDPDILQSLQLERIIINENSTMTILLPSNLRELSLVKCFGISVADWSYIGGLSSLNKLSVNQCSICDWGMSSLVHGLSLQELVLMRCTDITEESLRHLGSLINLRKIRIVDCPNISADGYALLGELENLSELVLSEVQVTDNAVVSFANIKCLHVLQISCLANNPFNAGDTSLSRIAKLTMLEELWINSDSIPDTGFRGLQGLSYLSMLNLNCCAKLEDRGFFTVCKVETLTDLNVSNCERLTDDGMSYISNLKLLQRLDVSGCHLLTDKSLDHFSKLIQLKELALRHCNEITDQGINLISPLKKLHHLDISGCYHVSDRGMFLVKDYFKCLEILVATGCTKISEMGISYLQELRLHELDISLDLYRIHGSCMQVNDISLFNVSLISSLINLNISCCHYVTDEGLQHLGKLNTLQKLTISRCHQVTDAGLSGLTDMRSLKEIDISMCVNVTDDGVEYLCQLQSLKYIDLHGCSMVTNVWPSRHPYIVFKYRLCT